MSSDLLALTGAFCALVMVLASFFLLYKGIITINQAPPGVAVDIGFQKMVRVQTQYPAIVLFIVGVGFLGASFWYNLSLRAEIRASKVKIDIPIESDDSGGATAHFTTDFGIFHVNQGVPIHGEIPSDIDWVDVTIAKTGYKDWEQTIQPATAKDGKLTMSAKLEKKVEQKPLKKESQIETPSANLPPLQLNATPSLER
jgi:hypothetical protein